MKTCECDHKNSQKDIKYFYQLRSSYDNKL